MKKTLLIFLSVLILNNAYGQVKATSAEINAGVDDDKFATALAMQGSKYTDQSGSKLYAVTAAGANTYTATITPAITVYSAGQIFFIKISTANTGASTLNLNSLGAKTLVKDATTALASGDLLANRIYAVAYDGTNFQVVNIASAITGTNLNISGNGAIGGGLGVGPAGVFPHIGIYNSRTLSGAASGGSAYGLINGGVIQSDVTGGAIYNQAIGSTVAGSFTLPLLIYNNASQGTLGAGSTVTSQIGYSAESTLIGATNNYGFYGAIPTGTNRYNLYMTGTAQNHLRGLTTFGGTTTPLGQLSIYPNDGTTKGLVIKTGASQSANVLEVQDAAGTPVTSILGNGLLTSTLYIGTPGVSNTTNINNSLVSLNNTGTVISRNVADNNPALSVNLANASSPGAIQRWQSSGTDVALMSKTGALTISGGVISAAPTTSAGAYSLLTRNDATGVVEKVSASSLVSGASYIQNGTAQQASSNFNISGNGMINGSLGIGVASPLSKLHLSTSALGTDFGALIVQNGVTPTASATLGWSANKAIMVQGSEGAFYAARDVTNAIETVMGVSSLGEGFLGSTTDHKLSLRTNNSNKLTIETNGDIGIGALATSGKLHVTQTTNTSLGGITVSNSTGGASARIWIDGSPNARIDGNSGGTGHILLNGAGAGLVGIGLTTTPSGRFDVRTGADGVKGIIIRANSATQSANLQEWQSSSGTVLSSVSNSGAIRTDVGLTNLTTGSNAAFVNPAATGTSISRNTADANPALVVNNANASSTGAVQKWQSAGADVASVSKTGILTMSGGVISAVPTTSAGAFNFLTRNNTTGAIEKTKPTTLAEFGITDKVSRLVAQTTIGNGDDQSYWTKIATINLGNGDHRDHNLQLGIAGATGSWGSVVVDIGVRQYLTGQTPDIAVNILAAGSAASWLTEDSFKVVSEGYATDFDVYVKKNINWGSLKIFELLSSNSPGSTVTYFSSQGWLAPEPTGTFSARSSGIKYKGSNIYHSGNNNILTHPMNGFTTSTNTAVIATDNIKSALEKLQGQVNARESAITAGTNAQYQRGDKTWQTLNTTAVPEGTNQYFSTTRVLNTALSGYSVGSNTALTSGDTHLTAFGKIQAQINTKANDASVVHMSNNETVGGVKKFSDAMGVSFTGTIPSGYKLAVGGSIIAEAIKVKPQGQWPDYVFEKNYPKLTLAEVEEFIAKNKHLPGVPSAAEVKKEGIDVGEMNAKLLKKIEELTLYMIEKDKEMKKMSEEFQQLKQEIRSAKKE